MNQDRKILLWRQPADEAYDRNSRCHAPLRPQRVAALDRARFSNPVVDDIELVATRSGNGLIKICHILRNRDVPNDGAIDRTEPHSPTPPPEPWFVCLIAHG